MKEIIKSTAGDNVPAEIEYQDEDGKVIGYWAYGRFDPDLPYQGESSIGNFMSHGGIDKLNEECGEVVQVIGKFHGMGSVLGQHWDGTNLKERLEDEIADMIAAARFVALKHSLDEQRINQRFEMKLAQFKRWDNGDA